MGTTMLSPDGRPRKTGVRPSGTKQGQRGGWGGRHRQAGRRRRYQPASLKAKLANAQTKRICATTRGTGISRDVCKNQQPKLHVITALSAKSVA